MRKVISISALILALTFSASAGDMPNGVNGTPQPTPAPVVQEPTTEGEMSAGATAPAEDGDIQNVAAVTLMQMVLNLLALS